SRRRHTSFSLDWSSDVCSSAPRPKFSHFTSTSILSHVKREEHLLYPPQLRDHSAVECCHQGVEVLLPVMLETMDLPQENHGKDQIGRASCRERGQTSVGAASLR